MNSFPAFSYAHLSPTFPYTLQTNGSKHKLFVILTVLDLSCGFSVSTAWLQALQPVCISMSSTTPRWLPSSFPPAVEMHRAPSKLCFPIFCHICICSSFCLECLLYFPTLSNDSCIPPPRPLLFSTRIIGKVMYFFKNLFCVRITITYSSSSLWMDIQAVNLSDYKQSHHKYLWIYILLPSLFFQAKSSWNVVGFKSYSFQYLKDFYWNQPSSV
mgnify:CR=1 FL=1